MFSSQPMLPPPFQRAAATPLRRGFDGANASKAPWLADISLIARRVTFAYAMPLPTLDFSRAEDSPLAMLIFAMSRCRLLRPPADFRRRAAMLFLMRAFDATSAALAFDFAAALRAPSITMFYAHYCCARRQMPRCRQRRAPLSPISRQRHCAAASHGYFRSADFDFQRHAAAPLMMPLRQTAPLDDGMPMPRASRLR